MIKIIDDKITVDKLVSEIKYSDYTNEDLDRILAAIQFRRDSISYSTKLNLDVGMKVSYTNKDKVKVVGTVTDIKRKNVVVDVSGQLWRVPGHMLTILE